VLSPSRDPAGKRQGSAGQLGQSRDGRSGIRSTLRVVVTCDWFLKYATAQSAALVRAGAEVLLLCREHPIEFGGDTTERRCALDTARESGVMVLEMPGRIRDVTAAPRLAAIRKRIASFAPDVVHAHAGSDPRALALVPTAHTVLTIHDPKPHPGQPVARSLTKRWAYKERDDAWAARASAIVVHSDRLRGEVKLRAGQRCFVVPHGLDVRNVPMPVPSQPAVGFFGRLEPYKGLEVLSRAMPRVWAYRPHVLLKVAGSGPSVLPLDDHRVRMERRYLPEAEIEDFFAATSLTVLPYTQASQTGVGSRAVGYGVPVVATNLGGLPELVLDDSYLVNSGDDEALANAILRHINDDLDVRRRVLTNVAAPRSWDVASAHSLEMYAQLVRPR
jgi:glycosyltransferase involved in cell wall biosynthesis